MFIIVWPISCRTLCVAEILRSPEISNLRSRVVTSPRPRYAMLQPSVHARTRPLNPLRHAGLLPGSRRRRARSPRPAAAIGGAEAQATAASSENALDRLFWTTLSRCWPRWTDVLEIVKSKTVVGWHRAGFRLYWRWHSRGRGGWPKVTAEIRALIRQMAEENAGWGAPKIHGELLKLGLVVCERTVARYLRRIRRRGNPSQSWLAFLENHREVIVAFDFFTVPSVTFRLLYGFFVIEHGRRKILHFNVTRHATAEWVVQQLREALPEAGPYRYAIFDRDSKYDADVITFLKATGLQAKQTSVQAPWQNGVAERWVGSCRREILDHVIPLNRKSTRLN